MSFILNLIHWYQVNADVIGVLLAAIVAAYEVGRKFGNFWKGAMALFLDLDKKATAGAFGPDVNGAALMDKAVAFAAEKLVPKLPIVLRPFATDANLRSILQWIYDHGRAAAKEMVDVPPQRD